MKKELNIDLNVDLKGMPKSACFQVGFSLGNIFGMLQGMEAAEFEGTLVGIRVIAEAAPYLAEMFAQNDSLKNYHLVPDDDPGFVVIADANLPGKADDRPRKLYSWRKI